MECVGRAIKYAGRWTPGKAQCNVHITFDTSTLQPPYRGINPATDSEPTRALLVLPADHELQRLSHGPAGLLHDSLRSFPHEAAFLDRWAVSLLAHPPPCNKADAPMVLAAVPVLLVAHLVFGAEFDCNKPERP